MPAPALAVDQRLPNASPPPAAEDLAAGFDRLLCELSEGRPVGLTMPVVEEVVEGAGTEVK